MTEIVSLLSDLGRGLMTSTVISSHGTCGMDKGCKGAEVFEIFMVYLYFKFLDCI